MTNTPVKFSVTSKGTAPKGWDLFMCSLKDTNAPADIHLGWKWNKSVEKGDWGSLKDE